MDGIVLAGAAIATAGLLVIRRRRRLRAPPRYDWSVVDRYGMQVEFVCGHTHPRTTEFLFRNGRRTLRFRRTIPRFAAGATTCGECLCETLKASKPVEAVKVHHLVLLDPPAS